MKSQCQLEIVPCINNRSEKKEDLVEQHECHLYSLYGCPRVMPASRVSKTSTEQIFRLAFQVLPVLTNTKFIKTTKKVLYF